MNDAASNAAAGGGAPAGGPRLGVVERATKETALKLRLELDAAPGTARRIAVPDGFFGHMLDAFATHGSLGLDLVAEGDTHVDLHHTVEDVGIALG
jgi:imidazoleglycerol-phosphate dehydratase